MSRSVVRRALPLPAEAMLKRIVTAKGRARSENGGAGKNGENGKNGAKPALERFPISWKRSRFQLIGNARTGNTGYTGHIPSG